MNHGNILLEIATERMVIDKDDECCIQLLAEAVNNRAKISLQFVRDVYFNLLTFTIFQLSLEKIVIRHISAITFASSQKLSLGILS